jgi:hypothetical protein
MLERSGDACIHRSVADRRCCACECQHARGNWCYASGTGDRQVRWRLATADERLSGTRLVVELSIDEIDSSIDTLVM